MERAQRAFQHVVLQVLLIVLYTVHGRQPKQPPGIHKAPQIMGKTTNLNWLAGFLNHQPYLVGRYTPNLKKSNNPPLLQLGALSAACCPKRMKCSDW